MRYKELVTTKLESLNNSINGINSLLSQQSLSREQFEVWYRLVKGKLEEVQTLINTEHQD
jgi:hypothetical protein